MSYIYLQNVFVLVSLTLLLNYYLCVRKDSVITCLFVCLFFQIPNIYSFKILATLLKSYSNQYILKVHSMGYFFRWSLCNLACALVLLSSSLSMCVLYTKYQPQHLRSMYALVFSVVAVIGANLVSSIADERQNVWLPLLLLLLLRGNVCSMYAFWISSGKIVSISYVLKKNYTNITVTLVFTF